MRLTVNLSIKANGLDLYVLFMPLHYSEYIKNF